MSWLTTRAPLALLGLALGCELFERDPVIPEQCKGTDGEVLARFDVQTTLTHDAGMFSECTVVTVGSSFELDCLDLDGTTRPVQIDLTAEPAIEVPAAPGDKVTLELKLIETQVGTWVVRRESGELLLAGNQANSTVPDDPTFFEPFTITVDDATCPELADEESCYFTQHLLLTIDDGAASATVTHGEWVDLDSGYRFQVERATQYRPGDGKACSVDDSLPAPFRFLIVARP